MMSKAVIFSSMVLLFAAGALAAQSRAYASATAYASASSNMRRRMQQTATAAARADAQNGAQVTSVAGAEADETGDSAANVASSGSGPGTVVNCELQTGPGVAASKECPQKTAPAPAPAASSDAAAGAAAGTSSGGAGAAGGDEAWATAPACQTEAGKAKIEYSKPAGNPWGFENGASCALRDAKGEPTVARQP